MTHDAEELARYSALLLYSKNKAERDAVRREYWERYGKPLTAEPAVQAALQPDANPCTCCGIRDVIPEQLLGIQRMREECDQRICDKCSTHLALAAVRYLLTTHTENR